MLQCVAVCCSVLQCVAECFAVCCSTKSPALIHVFERNIQEDIVEIVKSQGIARSLLEVAVWCVCCSVLQRVAACCSVLQCFIACCSAFWCVAVCCSALKYNKECCCVLQCGSECCSMW